MQWRTEVREVAPAEPSALFAITAASAAVLIPAGRLEGALQHPVGAADYLQLAWLVASLATVGGALGSLMESDLAVRNAAHCDREDERTEAGKAPG